MSTPAEQVRESLTASRTAGLPFDRAWSRAYGALTNRGAGALAWRAAIRDSREAFERAYSGAPPLPGDRAAAALVGAFDA